MFVQFENFVSVNSLKNISRGTYCAQNEVFLCSDFSASLFLYTLEGEAAPCSADLLYVDASGRVFFRDYVRLPDSDWRDSFGERAADIREMLPSELLGRRPDSVQSGMVENRGSI